MNKRVNFWVWMSLGCVFGFFLPLFFFVHEPGHLLIAGGGEWYTPLRVRVRCDYSHALYFAGFGAEIMFAWFMMWLIARRKGGFAGWFYGALWGTYFRAFMSEDFGELMMSTGMIFVTWTLICLLPLWMSTRLYKRYFAVKTTRVYQGVALK